MKVYKRMFKALTIKFLALGLFALMGCENHWSVDPYESSAEESGYSSIQRDNDIQVLRFSEGSRSFQKQLDNKKWITVQDGGTISLSYDSPMNQCGNSLYVRFLAACNFISITNYLTKVVILYISSMSRSGYICQDYSLSYKSI